MWSHHSPVPKFPSLPQQTKLSTNFSLGFQGIYMELSRLLSFGPPYLAYILDRWSHFLFFKDILYFPSSEILFMFSFCPIIVVTICPGLPGSVPVYSCCLDINITKLPFHTQKCSSLDDKLYIWSLYQKALLLFSFSVLLPTPHSV